MTSCMEVQLDSDNFWTKAENDWGPIMTKTTDMYYFIVFIEVF